MADGQDKQDKDRPAKVPPWVPISKDAVRLLPVDREYTEIEALFSLAIDHNNSNPVTVAGLAGLWRWSRKRVRCFLPRIGVDIVYPEDTRKSQNQKGYILPKHLGPDKGPDKGQMIFIDYRHLRGNGARKGTDQGPLLTRNKEIKKKQIETDPRVKVFSDWWMEKYKHRFHCDYIVTNWGKFGKQVKDLLALPLSFDDLQYLAIEFFMDEDPFITGSDNGTGTGHNIGMFLARIGLNIYRRYQDPKFIEKNKEHIVNEDGSPKYTDA